MRTKIREYHNKIQELELKTTLGTFRTKENEMNPLTINLQLKKTLYNKENSTPATTVKKEKEQNVEPCVPVNCVYFN